MAKNEKEKKDELVKVKVLKPFRDKFDHKTRYETGTEVEFDSERAQDVVSRGLAELSEPIG